MKAMSDTKKEAVGNPENLGCQLLNNPACLQPSLMCCKSAMQC